MTILIDMDDVLECLLEAWLDYNNKKFGTDVRYDDIREWDLSKAFPGLTREETYAAELDENFWKDVRPIPGAPEAVKRLIDDGHDVIIVTATLYETLKEKMEDVLFKYFPFVTRDMVIITFRKQLIKGDILIDDGPHNLIGGDYRKILFNAPHNRDFDEKSIGAERVYNWEQAYECICRIAEAEKKD